MHKIDDGGQAFPATYRDAQGRIYIDQRGMTLRDYFAIRAPMPTADGLSQFWAETILGRSCPDCVADGKEAFRFWLEAEAKYRYAVADAMLAARAATAFAKEADHG